ncbi:glycosyl transferase family 39 [Thermodesulfatator indicus DSM 15286]|uniref:Glycosyl transferase family 39 n=1 Tax=Thermodesulfatator indicus (strain DSM 15286 / JCM 11887 / CIR29812) TaxID=667014 RepID=F8ABK4_THEID|nr:glycosyltransferase family 39 protein [Thermodesulfatator indicus]AEH45601.1 glycosyl transferase family 39 [Thermodesulfatator indicus DSM 15286]
MVGKSPIKKLILLIFLALLLRLLFLPLFIHQPLNIVDEQHYNKLALAILERGEYGWAPGKPTAIRPPLYPAFLAGVYKVFGPENYNAVRVIQIFLSILSGLLVYSLAKKIFHEEKVALLATGLFLFYPSLVIFNYLILTEILFIFLFLLALWLLVAGIEQLYRLDGRDCFATRLLRGFAPRNDNDGEKPRNDTPHPVTASEAKQSRDSKAWIYSLLAGIFWGLASLTRSVTYPLTPFIALFLFLVSPNKKQGLFAGILFIFATVLTLSPWIARNYQVFGHFIAVDTMGGLNLYMGNYEHTPLHRAWAAVDNPPEIAWYRGHEKELGGLNEAEKQRWAIKKALEFMKENPGLTALRTLIKTANFWQLERTIIAGMQRGYFPGLRNKLVEIWISLSILGAYVFVVIFGFCGLLWRALGKNEIASVPVGDLAMTEGRRPLAMTRDMSLRGGSLEPTKQSQRYVDWLIVLLILYFTAIHAIVFGHSRYHLPLIPLLCMYASYFVVHFKEFWQNQRRRFWWVFVPVCLVFGLFWTYDIFIGSKDKIEAFLRIVF